MSQAGPRRIVVACSDPTLFKLLNMLLTAEGYQVIQTQTGDDCYNKASSQRPHMVIIDDALPGTKAAELCRRLRKNPATNYLALLVLSSKGDAAEKIAAFEAGADEFLTKPFDAKEMTLRVKNLIGRVHVPTQATAAPQKRAQGIAIFGAKGGVGKTTIGTNLALAIHRQSSGRVLLFDADFFFGDIGVHLNLPPTRSVIDLIEHMDELDTEFVEQVILRHPSGLRVLLSPFRPEKADLITPDHVKRLLGLVSEQYDHVIVDCHSAYDERMLTILEWADDILLIVTPEVGPIKNTSMFLDIADKLGLSLDKIHIILNRANSNVGIDVSEIERSFSHRVEFHLVSGGRPVVMSVNQGQPLILSKADHPLAQEISRIAARIAQKTSQG
jgi:pilus assembly protein CpaE